VSRSVIQQEKQLGFAQFLYIISDFGWRMVLDDFGQWIPSEKMHSKSRFLTPPRILFNRPVVRLPLAREKVCFTCQWQAHLWFCKNQCAGVLKIATSSPFFLITRTELHFYAVYIILSFFVFGTLSALEKRSILPMFRVEMVKKGGGACFWNRQTISQAVLPIFSAHAGIENRNSFGLFERYA